ncbi:MAG: diacylglycerol kinase [Nitrospirae bacterium]|nr:diacylglycerol kinase [Nitrospirota bacterium]MCL5421457.1 diacylglycerol kinase [Nitrospirota bacterium]
MRRWIKSANFAIEGILHGTKTQRHLRYHLYSAAFILILSYVLGVSRNDFLIIALMVIVVLLAELFNTAIETVVDLASPEHSEKAKIAKDVAAGAVLITAFGAAVIGYIILLPYIRSGFQRGFHIAKHSAEEISVMAVTLVLILVVVTKAYFGKGTPLRGGIPSGHSALAFSIWVVVIYTTGSLVASVVCFILAALIAASRVVSKIHTPWEVMLGGLMGALLTFILFAVFS